MSIDEHLVKLQAEETELDTFDFAPLSGLVGDEQLTFQDVWGDLTSMRRLDIVSRLVEIAIDDAGMDFVSVFLHGLQDINPAVRECSLSGLWETDDRTTIPKVIDRLENDSDDQVRAAAAQTLGHFASLSNEGKLIPRDSARVWNALLAALEDDDEPLMVRRRALEGISPFNVSETRAWIRWGFDHDENLLRQSALFAMGRNGDSSWVDLIVNEMKSDDPGMRYEAANAARELAMDETLPYLKELVEDIDSQVSSAALQAIAVIGGPRARNILRGYIVSGDDPIQEAAREALSLLDADLDDLSMMRFRDEDGDERLDDDL